MKSLKVLHLIPTLSSGGAERQLVNLVASTSKKTVEHVVCVINKPYFFASDLRSSDCKVIEFDISAKRPFFSAASKFRRAMREEKPDIVHSWLYDANVSAYLAKFPNGKIPIITSLQLSDYEPEVARLGNWPAHKMLGLKAIDKMTSLLAKPYYVACSEYVKKSYQKYFGIDESKIRVIYNSVDRRFLTASAEDLTELRRELDLSPDAFVYLNVARLDPQKNHKILFEAFTQVAAENPNAVLLLAGAETAWGNELKKLAEELQIAEKVIFLGSRNDVGALLELADVFVFPSNFEGLGVALVEAMFKSLPCIASRIEVFQEFIKHGETGLLVDPTSALELKNAMIELYKNADLRKSLGEKALQKAEAEFNANKTAAQWEEFYQKVFTQSRK